LSPLAVYENIGAVAMSEFKFACPVCGQHLTADSTTAGSQISCPTCFQKIVVPQAPASTDTKFILSASQVAKPRPTAADAVSQLGPLQPSSPSSSWPAPVALLVLLCAAGAAAFIFRDRIFKPSRATPPPATNAPSPQPTAPLVLNTNYPVPTNITWTLDLTNAVIPETPVAGRLHGSGFFCEKAVLRGGQLILAQGKTFPWDLGLAIQFVARQGEELSGKTVEIPPERPRAPKVVMRWKNAQQKTESESYFNGYLLKVTFGQATNSRMPGQIYLGLPDEPKSFVAGTFDAEITKPPPPKAGSQKRPKRRN
jgi:DNA-directed RNA polymerase subunit RPC12/RpoP